MISVREVGPAVIWGRVIIALLIITSAWMIVTSVTSTAYDALNATVRADMTGEGATTFDIIQNARSLTIDGGAVAMAIAVIVWGLRKMAQRERVTEIIYS